MAFFLSFIRVLFLAVLAVSPAVGLEYDNGAKGVAPGRDIRNLVTFGDSYTDVVAISDGGTPWPVYAASYANLTLYPYARSGATCSNNLTNRPYPSLFESQLPTYYNDTWTGTDRLNPASTLYTLWIGTNDLGGNALITGHGSASLVDVTSCMVNWVQQLYNHGARNFLFQNMIPLEKAPLYATDSWPNRYWNLERNTTEWNVVMKELVLSGNELTSLRLQALAPTLHEAHVGIFDAHSLFADMYSNPIKYLNGTAPLNVDDAVHKCVYELNGGPTNCTTIQGSNRDSYLWYDELHPSEQADRIVAREIAQVVKGEKNIWTTWLS